MKSLRSKIQVPLALALLGFALLAGCSAPRMAELVPTSTPTKTPRVEPSEVPATAALIPTVAAAATDLPSPTVVPPTAVPTIPPTATAEQPTPEPTAAPSAQPTADIERSAVVIGNSLNVRAAPGTNANILGQVSGGTTLRVLGRSEASDWLQVCCAARDQKGWVFGELVRVDGSVAELPVSAAAVKAEAPAVQNPTPIIKLEVPAAQNPVPVMKVEPTAVPNIANSGYPVTLRVPAIGIRAPVEWVGTTPDGAMDVPKDWDSVGWWQPGTLPGNPGSAVLAGHYDRDKPAPNGSVAAVFWNLARLNPGDAVFLTSRDGREQKFVVTGKESYPFDRAPLARIFGGDGVNAQLNLITCGGTWNAKTGNYSNRWVVYTKLAQ